MWLDPAIFRPQLTEMLDRRAAGSHDNFFDKEKTVQWLQGTEGILSITGRSGYGKTVLAASVVEKVSQNLQPSHFIGYAFCLKLSVAAILRSLIWQIVQNRNVTTNQKALILEFYREHSTAGSHSVLPDNHEPLVFRELYTQILQPYGHVTLVLDSIDRSDSPQLLERHILSVRDSLLGSSRNLKILFTGLEAPQVPQKLREASNVLILMPEDVKVCAEKFFNQSFQNLEPRMNDIEEDEVRMRSLRNADGGWHSILNDLAKEYLLLGRHNEAEVLEQKVLEFVKERFHTESQPVLESRRLIAVLKARQGQRSKAEDLQRQLLETSTRMNGLEHEFTRVLMNDLSLTLSTEDGDSTKTKEAIALQEQLVETGERLQLPNEGAYGLLTHMNNLACSYAYSGQPDKAETTMRRALARATEQWGEDNESTVDYKGNLGNFLAKQEKWAEAEVLEVGVMETRKRTLGVNHPKTLSSMASVAWAFQQQGRYQEAKELETQVLEHRTRLLGALHPETLLVTGHLAWTLFKLGEYVEAARYARIVQDSRIPTSSG